MSAIRYDELFGQALDEAGGSGLRAMQLFEQKVTGDADTAEKYFWLGNACMVGFLEKHEAFNLDRAVSFLERALQIDPKHTGALARLRDVYLQQGKSSEARSTELRRLKADPSASDNGRNMLAAEEAKTHPPASAADSLAKSKALQESGDVNAAVQLLENARRLYPGDAQLDEALANVLTARGAVLAGKGQSESAFQDFLRASQVHERNWYVQHNLFASAEARGDFDLALRAGRRALQLNPALRSKADFEKRLTGLEKQYGRKWWRVW